VRQLIQLMGMPLFGSASSCLQLFFKYHPVIEIINNQNLLIAFTNFFQWKIIGWAF
jgi:hypothetical protein